ncbi:MAG TPA: FliH/SctL family protein [Verrucomicrobiae bacterium]|jgi:flagellar assembly protein FliH
MSARCVTISLPHLVRDVRVTPLPRAEGEGEQAAYERGRLDGEKALHERLVRQRNELLELQQGVLKSLQQAVPQVVRDCEQALTALALEVAQKLVAGLPLSAEMVAAAVQEALGEVEEATDCHIYLHPEDLDLLQQVNSNLLASNVGNARLHFHRAPEVTRGGCLVKTRFGVIDARRETKLELLQKSLLA